MKSNNITRLLLIVLSTVVLFTISCKKHPENTRVDYNHELTTVAEYLYPQQFTDQFILSFFKSFYDSTLRFQGITTIDSAKTTLKNSNDSLIVEMEYWTSDTHLWHHIDPYRHYRCGTYQFITDSLFMFSDTGTVTINIVKPFYYDSLQTNINNIKIVKTRGDSGNEIFNVKFENIVMDGNYANKFTWRFNADFTYELFKDASTPFLSNNDYFLFSGNISGNLPSGDQYNVRIDTDTARYKIDYLCKYIVEGKAAFGLESESFIDNDSLLYIDFLTEDGCNNLYQITVPGKMSTKSPIE